MCKRRAPQPFCAYLHGKWTYKRNREMKRLTRLISGMNKTFRKMFSCWRYVPHTVPATFSIARFLIFPAKNTLWNYLNIAQIWVINYVKTCSLLLVCREYNFVKCNILPRGPRHCAQQLLSFGRQAEQTRWPAAHWKTAQNNKSDPNIINCKIVIYLSQFYILLNDCILLV